MKTQLCLGGIRFQIEHPAEIKIVETDGAIYPDFRSFLIPSGTSDPTPESDVLVEVTSASLPEPLRSQWNQEKMFLDTLSTWSMRRPVGESWAYHFGPTQSVDRGGAEVFHMLCSSDFRKVRVHLPAGVSNFDTSFVYPLDEVLGRHVLPYFNAILVHASGVQIGGKGFLFLGDSEAGKSTIATLLEKKWGPGRVLSDDRMVVREVAGSLRMFGTPWHGTLERISPRGIELGGFFFLDKTPFHSLRPLSRAEFFERLFKVALGTWWLPESVGIQLSFLQKVVMNPKVSASVLGFKPEVSVADFIQRNLAEIESSIALRF